MQKMTSKERIGNTLQRKPVDHIGVMEHFWGDTLNRWKQQGKIKQDEDLIGHFGLDMQLCWVHNCLADLDWEPEVIEENEETVLKKDANGAFLRQNKMQNGTPEHVDFSVTDRASWEELVKPLLVASERRLSVDVWKENRKKAAERDLFFCWSGVNVFELMHPVCGHEHMLVGMAMDPDWVKDMADTYAELQINLMEMLFKEGGLPDGVWFYEDMGFKERPFMSPDMYRELIFPAHKRTVDFAHSLDLPVIMHSCGFIEPLLPHMVEAGIDCLQVIEVKAGMDPLRIHRNFGDRIVLCGGMDARNLVANDRAAIERELQEKIPVLKENSGYILHSDHSIPTDCDYETYRFFVDEGRRLGTY